MRFSKFVHTPLFAFAGRLAQQKGLDVIFQSYHLLNVDAQFVFLATGERPKLGVDMWRVLADVQCPALVVRGARSDMFAPETVAKMQAANARMRVVDVDAGHNVAGENPAGFLAAVRPFLTSLQETRHEYARH